MTSTAMPMDRQKRMPCPPAKYHSRAETSAMPMTTGTNTALMRSAKREIGALEEAASSMRRTICDSVVSLPTRRASSSK